MLTLLALALAYAGFTAVCLAMERHHRQVLGRPRTRRTATALRIAGGALLALALATCVGAYPGSVGIILWFGLLTASGTALAILLPYLPRATWRLAIAAPLLVGAATLL